ncbi:hypothetical protein A2326_04220 [candidate division WWE3 bacterium RIFOXYB2_FULL_41_6]|nr:MAG: hypothetical protein A2326_04220 [candidate division WWE3 bacterium RIFOXYB2_FULL_41_6]
MRLKLPYFGILFVLGYLFSPHSYAKSVTLYPLSDIKLNEQSPTLVQADGVINAEAQKIIAVGDGDYERLWSIIKFDTSSIPEGSTITGASLFLYINLIEGENVSTRGSGCAASIRRVTSSWREYGTSWSNKPTYTSSGTSIFIMPATGFYQAFDVKSIVEKWTENSSSYPNYGFYLVTRATEGYCAFDSRESIASHRPKLTVNYNEPITFVPSAPLTIVHTDPTTVLETDPNAPLVGAAIELNLTNIQVTDKTPSSVKISWDTNKKASGVVNYKISTRLIWSSKTGVNDVTHHEVDLSRLSPGTKYAYSVKSKDADGIEEKSSTLYFSTPKETVPLAVTGCDSQELLITDITVDPSIDGAVFKWKTSACSNSGQIEQVKSSQWVYVDETYDENQALQSYETNFGKAQLSEPNHEVTAKSIFFEPNTTYAYRIYSKDTNGREATTLVSAFSTLPTEDQSPDEEPLPNQENTSEPEEDESVDEESPEEFDPNNPNESVEKGDIVIFGPESGDSNIQVLIAIVVAAFFFLVIVILVIVLLFRGNRSNPTPAKHLLLKLFLGGLILIFLGVLYQMLPFISIFLF